MKNRIATGVLFIGLAAPLFGQFVDTFSATVADRWGTPASTPIGPPTSGGASSISFTQDNVNSRVDWGLTLTGSSQSANLMMPLGSYRASYDADWDATLAVVNSFSAVTNNGQSVQIGLLAFNTTGMSANPTADYIKLVLVQADTNFGGLAQGNVIHYGSHSNTFQDPYSTTPSAGSSVTLKVAYSAASHTMGVYNGGSLLRTFGIAGSGGDGSSNQTWGMNSGDTFTIGLYAQSVTNGTGTTFTVSPGTAYIDSLTINGFTAIPEPSTYAALFGVAVLMLAIYRRRRVGRS